MEDVAVLKTKLKELETENDNLKCQLYRANKKIGIYEKTLQGLNGHYVQRELWKNGLGQNYNEDCSMEKVLELWKAGWYRSKIARHLGVNLVTVNRRLDELNDAGLIKKDW